MTHTPVGEDVIQVVRDLNRPATFAEIASALERKGITKSQVHNAVYRLSKSGALDRNGSGGAMRYGLPKT